MEKILMIIICAIRLFICSTYCCLLSGSGECGGPCSFMGRQGLSYGGRMALVESGSVGVGASTPPWGNQRVFILRTPPSSFKGRSRHSIFGHRGIIGIMADGAPCDGHIPVQNGCPLTTAQDSGSFCLDPTLPCYHTLPSYIQPKPLSCSKITPTSITVTWPDWNEEVDVGNGPIVDYKIEIRKVQEADFTEILKGRQLFHQFNNLEERTAYEFRVTVIRDHPCGEGQPSNTQICTTSTTECGGPCSSIGPQRLSYGGRMALFENGGFGLGAPPAPWANKRIFVFRTPPSFFKGRHHHSIFGHKGIIGIMSDKASCGGYIPLPNSCPLAITQDSGFCLDPTLPCYLTPPSYIQPKPLSCSVITPTSITVTWSAWDEEVDVGNGPIVDYKIEIRKVQEADFTEILKGRQLFHQFNNLEERTAYEFRVTVIRDHPCGEGQPSNTQRCTTSTTAFTTVTFEGDTSTPSVSVTSNGRTMATTQDPTSTVVSSSLASTTLASTTLVSATPIRSSTVTTPVTVFTTSEASEFTTVTFGDDTPTPSVSVTSNGRTMATTQDPTSTVVSSSLASTTLASTTLVSTTPIRSSTVTTPVTVFTTSEAPVCNLTEFQCVTSGYCIPRDNICDGENQCLDGSDESVTVCCNIDNIDIRLSLLTTTSTISAQWSFNVVKSCVVAQNLTIQQLDSDGCDDSDESPMEVSWDDDTRIYTKKGLEAYSKYNVTIALTTVMNDIFYQSSQIRTDSSEPTGRPRNLKEEEFTGGGRVVFRWNEPECGTRHGEIIGYEYDFRKGSGIFRRTGRSGNNRKGFSSLAIGERYSFRVRAVTDKGIGPKKMMVRFFG